MLLLLLAPTDSRGNFRSSRLEAGRNQQDQAQPISAPGLSPSLSLSLGLGQTSSSRASPVFFYLLLRPGQLLASGVYSFTSLGTASAAELSYQFTFSLRCNRLVSIGISSFRPFRAHTTCAATSHFPPPLPSTGPFHARVRFYQGNETLKATHDKPASASEARINLQESKSHQLAANNVRMDRVASAEL